MIERNVRGAGLLVGFAALCFLQASASRRAEAAGDHALIVGVNKCGDPTFPRLEYCEADAEDLADVLREAKYNVKVLTNSRETEGQTPRKQRILDALDEICNESRGGTLFVFLSGHGISLGEDAKRGYFLPSDANHSGSKYNNLLAIETEVLARMERSGASKKFLFVDACREKGTKNLDPPIELPDDDSVAAAKTHVVYSCKTGQISKEDKLIGHGVFTYFLIKGLRGRAVEDSESFVRMEDLYLYLKKQVPHYVQKYINKEIQQTPDYKKPDDESVSVVPYKKPGSVATVIGQVRPTSLSGFPTDWRSFEEVKNESEFVGLSFTGTFTSGELGGKRFINCRFKNCKFGRAVNFAACELIDCVLENADFTQARNTVDIRVYGPQPADAPLIWGGEDRIPTYIDR